MVNEITSIFGRLLVLAVLKGKKAKFINFFFFFFFFFGFMTKGWMIEEPIYGIECVEKTQNCQ